LFTGVAILGPVQTVRVLMSKCAQQNEINPLATLENHERNENRHIYCPL